MSSFVLLVWRHALHASADWVSAGRALLGVVAFSLIPIDSLSTFEVLAYSILIAALFASDAVDGMIARRQGTESSIGSFLDVIGDRVVEYSACMYLVRVVPSAAPAVLVLVCRDVLVDFTKLTSSWLGHDLTRGVLVRGALAVALVASRPSRIALNVGKCLIAVLAVAVASGLGGSSSLLTIALSLTVLLSLVRGAASVSELAHTIGVGRVATPNELTCGYALQVAIGLLTLIAIILTVTR